MNVTVSLAHMASSTTKGLRDVRRTVALCCFTAGSAALLPAQQVSIPGGKIRGIVVDGGRAPASPVPFAIVLLLRSADTTQVPGASTLSSGEGRFSFAGLAPGDYFLFVRRLGYGLDSLTHVAIARSDSAEVQVFSHARPLTLPAVQVTDGCLDKRTIGRNSAVAALWSEARKTMQTRRAFLESYRFLRHEERVTEDFVHNPARTVNDTTFASDPVRIRADNLREEENAFAGSVDRKGSQINATIRSPNEAALLSQTFLERYCLIGGVERDGAGNLFLRFRPNVPAAKYEMTVRGTIMFDTVSLGPTAMHYTYDVNRQVVGRASVAYAEVRVGQNMFRLPKTTVIEFVDPRKRSVRWRFTAQTQYRAFEGLF